METKVLLIIYYNEVPYAVLCTSIAFLFMSNQGHVYTLQRCSKNPPWNCMTMFSKDASHKLFLFCYTVITCVGRAPLVLHFVIRKTGFLSHYKFYVTVSFMTRYIISRIVSCTLERNVITVMFA